MVTGQSTLEGFPLSLTASPAAAPRTETAVQRKKISRLEKTQWNALIVTGSKTQALFLLKTAVSAILNGLL